MLAQLCQKPPIVLAKDAFDDWSDVVKIFGPDTIDGVILSPGPGTPTHPEDIGTLSPSIIQENPELPILGVCLGHQIMGHVYGATVDLCGPVHGQVRPIEQQSAARTTTTTSQQPLDDDPLWKDIPQQVNVTRYHSLAVRLTDNGDVDEIPLRPTAYSSSDNNDRILMGMTHESNPHFGVQFHPESVGSEYGLQLLRNFCDVCQKHKSEAVKQEEHGGLNGEQKNGFRAPKSLLPHPYGHDRQQQQQDRSTVVNGQQTDPGKSKYEVLVHKVSNSDMSTLQVFEEFLSREQYSVWLDTSMGVQSAANVESGAPTPAYSSIMGTGQTTIEYFGKEHDAEHQGVFRCDQDKGRRAVTCRHENIFSFLQEEHANATRMVTMVNFDNKDGAPQSTTELPDDGNKLPFDFRGGHVGYLGYEARHDSERILEEQECGSRAKWQPDEETLCSPTPPSEPNGKEAQKGTPTAAFLFLDKSWVYDHSKSDWYLIALVDRSEEEERENAFKWMQSTALRMANWDDSNGVPLHVNGNAQGHVNGECNGVGKVSKTRDNPNAEDTSITPKRPKFVPNRSRKCYNQNFVDCQEQIRLGESYELCLTNQLEADVTLPKGSSSSSPLDLYKALRTRNPAPFSAFLNWNTNQRDTASSSLAICCSSPERFVSVKQKRSHNDTNGSHQLQVEAKPIKGTCARVLPQNKATGLSPAEIVEDKRRALDLQASVKNRAENLMIVDLLRNDLSRVCQVGSVHVSNLMDIESYATVHQMVSTIRGALNPLQSNAVDVLKATFPGGSMTGAPKIRTMEILDRLEEGVRRGPYSGCLGYISMNGCMDMNIVIRTAVLTPSPSLGENEDSWKVSIGAGGAITALSESTDEYEEMILKASAVIQSVEAWVDGAAQQRNAS